jgi:DNA-binding CsgD family transcriptional regulator
MTGKNVNIVIDPRLQALLDNSPGPWGCKDRNSIFLYANEAYGRLVGVPHFLELIGKREDELPCGAAECADLYRQQDREVMEKGLPLRILDIHPYANDNWRAFIFIKTPLLDAQRNIIGTIFYGADASTPLSRPLTKLVNALALQDPGLDLSEATRYSLLDPQDKKVLSRRETEVLFYLLNRRTLSEISRDLDVSEHSIQQFVAQLIKKFAAASQADLVDKAMRQGYSSHVPESLFDQQISLILREKESCDA